MQHKQMWCCGAFPVLWFSVLHLEVVTFGIQQPNYGRSETATKPQALVPGGPTDERRCVPIGIFLKEPLWFLLLWTAT